MTLDEDLTSGDEIYIVVNSSNLAMANQILLLFRVIHLLQLQLWYLPDNFCSGAGSDITLTYDGGLLGIGAGAMWYDDQGLTNSVGKGDS